MTEYKNILNESLKTFLDVQYVMEKITLEVETYSREYIETVLETMEKLLIVLDIYLPKCYEYNIFEENQSLINHTLLSLKNNKDKEEYYKCLKLLGKYWREGYQVLFELLNKNNIEFINIGKMNLINSDKIDEEATIADIYKYLDYSSLNDLEGFFFCQKHNKMTKWLHYFEIYHRHFEKYRNKPITVMEIGVFGGGSMQMWKNYFGPSAKIIGIDIDPKCKEYEDEQTKIYIGSQEDREFLRSLKEEVKSIDILIDDGGHTMNQQIVTFEELYDCIKEDGVYLCEDLHTSYWERYGGGFQKQDSFIEYSKTFIDKLNAWHSETKDLRVDNFTRASHSLHYYDSILVIEKRKTYKPGSVIIEVS